MLCNMGNLIARRLQCGEEMCTQHPPKLSRLAVQRLQSQFVGSV